MSSQLIGAEMLPRHSRNGPILQPLAASPLAAANARWLAVLLVWLCLAPTLPGTPFKHWYAFGLAGLAGIWCMIRVDSFGLMLRQWDRPEHFMLIIGLLGTLLSTAISPRSTCNGDLFQLAREGYLVFVFGFLTILIRQVDRTRLAAILHQFVNVFLCGAILLCVLQQYSTAVFDFLLTYYYILETSDAAGFMRSRPALTFGNPNNAGMAICFVAILGLTQPRLKMSSIIFILVLSCLGILWTGSRTALFSYLAAVSLIAGVQNYRIVVGMVCIALALIYLHPLIANQQLTEWADGMWIRVTANRSSMDARMDLWNELLVNGEWRIHSWFGLGPSTEELIYVDNGYILALYRYGYLGAVCYALWPLILCGQGWRRMLYHIRCEEAVRLATIATSFMVSSFAMVPLSDPRLGTLYLLIVATALPGEEIERDDRGSISTSRTIASQRNPSLARESSGSRPVRAWRA